MSVALLLIGSLPMLPNTHLAMAEHMHHESSQMTTLAMQSMKNHAMSDDMKDCRIECACGCHDHIDTLPHLLAPHIMSQFNQVNIASSALSPPDMEVVLREFPIPIPIPPPEHRYS